VEGENNRESITLPYYDRRSFLHIQEEKKGNWEMALMLLNRDFMMTLLFILQQKVK